jgi:hypothetical protein
MIMVQVELLLELRGNEMLANSSASVSASSNCLVFCGSGYGVCYDAVDLSSSGMAVT